MSGHSPTPAPWIAKRASKNTYTRVFANEAGGEWLVAQCHEWSNGGYGPSREESEANARLIAAAPDLLEALVGMVRLFASLDLSHWNGSEPMGRAEAAISKATSSSSAEGAASP